VAKNGTENLSQLFNELQGSNSEFKLITLKPITGTYFDTNLLLAGLPMMTFFNFLMFISRLLEELLGSI